MRRSIVIHHVIGESASPQDAATSKPARPKCTRNHQHLPGIHAEGWMPLVCMALFLKIPHDATHIVKAFMPPWLHDLCIPLVAAVALMIAPVCLQAASLETQFEPRPFGLIESRMIPTLPEPPELEGPTGGGMSSPSFYWLRLRIDSMIPTPTPVVPSLVDYNTYKFIFPQSFGDLFWANLNRKFTGAELRSRPVSKEDFRKSVGNGKFNFNIGYQF